ncbi:hypothetical protein K470DRAFT_261090 [Piedraia hortae CBS 480.64]|uniref:Uncharacterized protein n=1 Tax=Piedraia hortae CBS 480.64 TaxID=1314780 RepID=A0A6A7BRJ3_9PEZI|nr:hypothetical protein K470DRAFT_261090 [Piedraia hortae CBS 480.64]
MRFRNWDVLLFPQSSHIPLQEFRTACYLQQDLNHMERCTTPILTSFVPSLSHGTPFRVSVHSWTKPEAIVNTSPYCISPDTKFSWCIRVWADGTMLSMEIYPEDSFFPKQIGKYNDTQGRWLIGIDGPSMTFPVFHKEILHQPNWNAADDLGRIKVQVSAGYEVDAGFVTLVDYVIFSFQPVPLGL